MNPQSTRRLSPKKLLLGKRTAHRWLYADSEPALEIACAWQAGQSMGLCGDWLNGGKVEGAWLSGRALALQVVNSLGTGCQDHGVPSRSAGLPLR